MFEIKGEKHEKRFGLQALLVSTACAMLLMSHTSADACTAIHLTALVFILTFPEDDMIICLTSLSWKYILSLRAEQTLFSDNQQIA